jgi:predicted amidophosphoribosyltransferase
VPAGLLAPVSGGAYEAPLRPLLLDFKERGCLSHAGPLGTVLAGAVLALVGDTDATVALVPVPSTAAARRRRGFDPVLLLARSAAAALRRAGRSARVVPALRPRGRSADQGGLTETQRSSNAHGRFAASGAALRLLGDGPVVVVDDIITTGHTLREAQSVLVESGLHPEGGALVAATRRRSPGIAGDGASGASRR